MSSSLATTSLNYLVEEVKVFTPQPAHAEGSYAQCVQHTAKALLNLARVRPDSVRDITTARPLQERLARHHKFIAFDLDPRKGCTECDNVTYEEQIFSSQGTLPLHALILGVTHYRGMGVGDLQLVTNAWGTGQQPVRAGGHCTITFTTENRLDVVRHEPYLCDDIGRETPLEALAFVECLHGLTSKIGDERADHDEGSLDLLGFPGAADYVKARLWRLPIYIQQLIDRLGCTHAA